MILKIFALLVLTAAPAMATDVALVLEQTVGDAPFRLGSIYPGVRTGSFYRPELLRYYISKITIHHDGSKSTHLPDLYLLVDAKELQRYPLGNHDIGTVDSISFFIGVDKARNHLDPATYPDWHPLALKVPSMHWGWAAGYRFVTYEGMAGTSANKLTAGFQIHTLDNSLYTRVASKASATRTDVGIDIPLRADYARLLDGIDVSTGVIMHGSTDEAVTLMKNIGSSVYSPGSTTSVNINEQHSSTMWPNPASEALRLSIGAIGARVVDRSGATVLSATCNPDAPMISVSTLSSGTYGVVLQYLDGSVRHETLVIVR